MSETSTHDAHGAKGDDAAKSEAKAHPAKHEPRPKATRKRASKPRKAGARKVSTLTENARQIGARWRQAIVTDFASEPDLPAEVVANARMRPLVRRIGLHLKDADESDVEAVLDLLDALRASEPADDEEE